MDSNYWIYWFDSRFPEHEAASKVVEEAVKEGILQSPVTLMEVAHYFRRLPKAQYDDLMGGLLSLSSLKVREFDFALARLSVELLGRYARLGMSGRDAAIIATMKAEGVNKIATHDKAFKAVPELTVIDPIPDEPKR
ncbi:type II toxin-antitoxin system VapC family toxin [Tardisphaera miroshnichenkoae]